MMVLLKFIELASLNNSDYRSGFSACRNALLVGTNFAELGSLTLQAGQRQGYLIS